MIREARWEIHNNEIEAWCRAHQGPKFHAVICDPPYGLEFMGKQWDSPWPSAGNLGGFANGNRPSFARQGRKILGFSDTSRSWGEALLPLLYPGALVFMFGGTRTWHRLATGMEDAGFEMWDTMMWLYGTGFPKAQDLSKLIDKANGDEREVISQVRTKTGGMESMNRGNADMGYRPNTYSDGENILDVTAPGSELSAQWGGHKTTALKPAWEPVICFKKPLDGTYAEMAMKYGSGALNIDGSRIGYQSDADKASATPQGICTSKNSGSIGAEPDAGRDESRVGFERPEQQGRYPANLLFDEMSSEMLDEQTGVLTSGAMKKPYTYTNSGFSLGAPSGKTKQIHDASSGGASRFFYCAKASTSERNKGLEAKNTHPTVKPQSLIEYIAKLALPPASVSPRRVLVPFAGSGSEMIGCLRAGWDEVIGVEQSKEYCEIAQARTSGCEVSQ